MDLSVRNIFRLALAIAIGKLLATAVLWLVGSLFSLVPVNLPVGQRMEFRAHPVDSLNSLHNTPQR